MGSERAAELLGSWLASVLVRWDDDGVASVLAGPSAAPLPGSGPVHVLTSLDPYGEPQPVGRNDALLRDLLAWAAAELPAGSWWPATGCDPASGHAELGIAIAGRGRAAAAADGARWGQLAIYELTDEELVVVPCDGSPEPAAGFPRAPRRWVRDAPGAILDQLPLEAWRSTFAAARARPIPPPPAPEGP
ncbi:MAG: DUF3293 domain-containing protein [Acidimicrobiales bacterium]